MDRRRFVLSGVGAGAGVWAALSSSARADDSGAIVLYSSVDDAILREVIGLFKRANPDRYNIRLVGDTEATKTTGLVQRLIAERDRPRADVWWSSEAIGTMMLAREGVLAAWRPDAIRTNLPEGSAWPSELSHERWTGLACRARVIVVNTKRVPEAERPTRLARLIDEKWRGRLGLARPQFGTTRGQFAALCAANAERAFVAWLGGLRANDAKFFDGNASVVRACANGEIDVGLTDTDDVWAGKARGWPVEMVFESSDAPSGPGEPAAGGGGGEEIASRGPMLVPNTLGLVAGGPNAEGGRSFAEFLLSADVERTIARSESKNLPMRPGLASEFPESAIPRAWSVDWNAALERLARAMELVEHTLGG
jgi:iron(III) transport system substrate-binding protein